MRARNQLVRYANEDFRSYILDTRRSINSELENLLAGIAASRLRPLLEYALLSKGKRLRPILFLLSAQSVGGDQKKVMRLATSFELLHSATLVHDDIIDEEDCRRGMKTLNSKWFTKGAILAGDALIALSINLASDYGTGIVKILSDIGLELSDGEYADAVLSLDETSEEQYFSKIKKKSASLFRGAAFTGALAAGGTLQEVEALGQFGESFGMAYQLNDDLDDLLSRKHVSQDLRNGNATLPLIYLNEHGNIDAKELIRKNFGSRNITFTLMEEIRNRMEESGAISYCKRRIEEHVARSRSCLRVIGDSKFKDYLLGFSECFHEYEG